MSTDLDHLRAFRAAEAEPDAAARAVARATLLERIEDASAPHPAAARRPWAAAATTARRVGDRPPRRRLLAGGLGLAAAAAVAIALVSGLGSGGVQPTEATAAQLLHRAAHAAAQGPDVVLRPGQYWYTRSESTSLSTYGDQHPFAVQLHINRESWMGADGTGRVRQRSVGEPRFVEAGGRAAWIAAGRPPLGVDMDVKLDPNSGSIASKPYPFGSDGLTYAELRALPTDTDALYDRIKQAAHNNHNSAGDAHEMFTIVGDLLREAPTPAALRAALYRIAARIPGVELLGEVRDAAGRQGVAVALTDPAGRAELVFDPRTAELLGERDESGGQPAFESAYLKSGVVDTTSEQP